MTAGFEDQLAAYLSGRRWFSGKGRGFSVTHVHALPWLTDSEPWVRTEIVSVTYDDGHTDSYQFPVGYRRTEDAELGHALIGTCDVEGLGTVSAYDAVYLKDASTALLGAFLERRDDSSLSFRVVEGAELPAPGAPGMVMRAEQSNTSIAYGEDAILKLFRRVTSGRNPDIEIHEALTSHGDENVAPLLGWVQGSWKLADGTHVEGDLGMLQTFLRTASDGWDLATASVRDLLVEEDLHPDEVGGDFAGEAGRLGEVTASVHAHLAALFGTVTLTSDQLVELADAMRRRLTDAVAVVPELEEQAPDLSRHYDLLAAMDEAIDVQRVHGDFHLGQTLRTVKGWKIIDFEGEPAKTLAERQAFDSPLRDVAGMLRSLSYASGAMLHHFGDSGQLRYRADEWSARNRTAFLNGYLRAGEAAEGAGPEHASDGGSDSRPRQQQVLLSAYEADKAVYEAVYEKRNRPSWLPIPLQAVKRIASGR